MRRSTPEGAIKAQICDYLRAKKIFFWVNQAGKIPGRRLLRVGIADILGVYQGRMLALEVKARFGVVKPEQALFLSEVRVAGGIGEVVRSVEDVQRVLEENALREGQAVDKCP